MQVQMLRLSRNPGRCTPYRLLLLLPFRHRFCITFADLTMNRLAVLTNPPSQSRRGRRLDRENRSTRGAGAVRVSLRPAAMRERDNQAWGDAISSAGSWSLTGRQYLLQNWRADVVLATDSGGSITDRIRYSAYGEPQRYSLCDLVGGGSAGTAPDSVIDADDYTAFINAFGASDALADVNADGVVDGDDYSIFVNVFSAGSDGPAGTGTLSSELDSGFRRGYAGYEFDPVLGASYASIYHVRNRVYDAENGRWNKRDPVGYVDGMGLYEYCTSMPIGSTDAIGLSPRFSPSDGDFIWPKGHPKYNSCDDTERKPYVPPVLTAMDQENPITRFYYWWYGQERLAGMGDGEAVWECTMDATGIVSCAYAGFYYCSWRFGGSVCVRVGVAESAVPGGRLSIKFWQNERW